MNPLFTLSLTYTMSPAPGSHLIAGRVLFDVISVPGWTCNDSRPQLLWILNTSLIPYRKSGSPYLATAVMCAVFSSVQTMVWLSVFGIVNVRTDVDAFDCTGGLHEHRKRVYTES